jgi:ATP-dependent protease ClpP protease subunit
MMRWIMYCWLVFGLTGLWGSQAFAAPEGFSDKVETPEDQAARVPPKNRVVMIQIKGSISRKALENVRKNIDLVTSDPIPAGLIVLLDSKGGDGIAAMKIGQLLRNANAHVFVNGDCASACVFILASGVVRGAPAYAVGIHQGRVTVSDDNAKILREVDLDKEPEARRIFAKFQLTAKDYFATMGMQPELYQAMQSHQLKGVYRLSHQELVLYGLVGFDDAYFKTRAAYYESLRGPYHMDKDELHRRTLRVAGQCATSGREQQKDFVACYKDVLRDPF